MKMRQFQNFIEITDIFFHIEPVETAIDGDSIDFEIRMYEGKPATINEVNISGNDRVYEHIICRELRTKPLSTLQSEDFIRSAKITFSNGTF